MFEDEAGLKKSAHRAEIHLNWLGSGVVELSDKRGAKPKRRLKDPIKPHPHGIRGVLKNILGVHECERGCEVREWGRYQLTWRSEVTSLQ